jgi:hypothetical protein
MFSELTVAVQVSADVWINWLPALTSRLQENVTLSSVHVCTSSCIRSSSGPHRAAESCVKKESPKISVHPSAPTVGVVVLTVVLVMVVLVAEVVVVDVAVVVVVEMVVVVVVIEVVVVVEVTVVDDTVVVVDDTVVVVVVERVVVVVIVQSAKSPYR